MKKQTLLFGTLMIAAVTFANPPKKTTTKTAVKKTTVAKTSTATPQVAADAVKFDKANTTEEFAVDGKDVLISGNDNKLTITGNVAKIWITGKNNDITIVAVNEITITGSGNFVSWEKSNYSGAKPVIQDKGGYNNVEKRSGNAQTKSEN